MPLDPQVEKLLQWAQRSRAPSYLEIGPVQARALYAKAAITLESEPIVLHDVSDHRITLHERALTVRQYTPAPHAWSQPQPALLFFHGGGFTIGSIDTHDRVCRRLAHGAGCLVFSVEYRLAPEHKFPSAHDDAFGALDWLRREAPSLGVDVARLAVGGDSAGGTLAAACAIHARELGWPLVLQLLFYPGLASYQDSDSHRRFARGYLLDAELIQWFFAQTLRSPQDRLDWRFAPLVAGDLRGLAPAWIAGAQFDPLIDENRAYAQRLDAAGVPVEFTQYDGMIHAFLQHGGFVPAVQRAYVDACRALERAFGVS